MDSRLGICLSGQLRKLNTNLRDFPGKNYFDNVYVHTWQDDSNPNLTLLKDKLPRASVSLESYSEFDHIVKNFYYDNLNTESKDRVSKLRYRYAQFYTVYKSFELAYKNGNKYLYYYRTRTDIDTTPNILKGKLIVNKLLEAEQQLVSNYLQNISNVLVDSYKNKIQQLNNGVCFTSLLGSYKDDLLITDYNFVLSRAALEKIVSIPVRDFMNLVDKYFNEMENSNLLYCASSPFIWHKILNFLGIMILPDTILGPSRIIRDHKNCTYKEYYGYIDN